MEDQTKIRLTAAEMSTLWTQYLNDTVSVCMNSHFLEKVEDTEVRPIIEFVLKCSKNNISMLKNLFANENFPIPIGFTVIPVGCLWIFHLTFGKFKLYLLANLINNLVYTVGIIPLLEKANFINYVKFTRIHHVIVAMIYSTMIYGYQMIYTKPNSNYLRLFNKKVLKS